MQAICLFDGVCILCSRAVQFTLAYEKAPTIQFVAIQSNAGKELAAKHNINPENPDSFLFIDGGIVYTKSDGVIALAKHIKGISFLAPIARIVPRFIRNWLYDRVAQNRYQWFGKRDVCIIPDAATRMRFILPENETALR